MRARRLDVELIAIGMRIAHVGRGFPVAAEMNSLRQPSDDRVGAVPVLVVDQAVAVVHGAAVYDRVAIQVGGADVGEIRWRRPSTGHSPTQ